MAEALVIPDASVILKWVLPPTDEADTNRALAGDSVAKSHLTGCGTMAKFMRQSAKRGI